MKNLQSVLEGPHHAAPSVPSPGQLARENERLAREVARLRAAVAKDAELLAYWADSIGMVRTAQAIRMRMRRDELRKLLDPAALPTAGVPSRMAARP